MPPFSTSSPALPRRVSAPALGTDHVVIGRADQRVRSVGSGDGALSSLGHIAELAQTLAPLLEDAADAGGRKSRGIEFVRRASGFTDVDPTGSLALDPTRRQMRAAVRRATDLILRAEAELQEAGSVIANGYLRLDREEWIRVVEKRNAALGR